MQTLLVFGEENGMKQILIWNISKYMYVCTHRFGLYPFSDKYVVR